MNQRGFVLLDVLLALAVLAIALPILIGLGNRDIELVAQARALTTATRLAQEKLFETEMDGLPPLGRQAGDFQRPFQSMASDKKMDDERGGFRWVRTVEATTFDDMREVRVRVLWPRGRTEEMVEVTSYVFRESQTVPAKRLYPR